MVGAARWGRPPRPGEEPVGALRHAAQRSAKRAEQRQEIREQVDFLPVHGVAQADDRLHVTLEAQPAREEQGVAVDPPLQQVDEDAERAANDGRGGAAIPIGTHPQRRAGGIGAQPETERKVHRIDQQFRPRGKLDSRQQPGVAAQHRGQNDIDRRLQHRRRHRPH